MKYLKFKKVKISEDSFFRSRLFLMLVGVTGLFGLVLLQFYKLQILEHEDHTKEVRYGTQREVELRGVRGLIFDRYGKPLAINKPIHTLKIDQQVKMSKKELNSVILDVIKVLESNGDEYIDEVPISMEAPFIFTEGEGSRKLFINSIPYNGREHRDEIVNYNATELFEYLRSEDVFQIDESYTAEEARKIIAIRHQMYQLAYQKYKPITIATDISLETLSIISENHQDYPSVFPEIESYRYYPYGKEFGNVLGYTRAITSKQFEQMQSLDYDKNDIIGQMGIEQTMESELRGKKGVDLIEVDNVGRKIRTIKSDEEIQGNNVFLTIDANIQLKAYEAIEKRLSEAIVQRMIGGLRGVKPLKPREILVSMVESNQLSMQIMKQAEEGTMQYELYNKLSQWFEEGMANEEYSEKLEKLTLKEFLILLLKQEQSVITDRELLLVLSEQGSLKLDDKLVQRIWDGKYPPLRDILIAELESGDLKPDQMAIDPFSASAVVVEVNTGNVLAVVGYPSYDSNDMTTRFNSYYSMLQDGIDQRNVLWNRALMTAKAPGSTFKMISALAGLEEGVVDTTTTINDSGPYTKVGTPYPKCWFFTNNGYGHGTVDVHRALEVSCNYYFYEVAYRLGLKYGMPYGAIDIFTKYSEMFGLGQKTGIELDETPPNVSNPANLLKSNISKSLNVLRNVSESGQAVFDQMAIELLSEGIYPYYSSSAKDFYGKLQYKVQKQIKREVDLLLQDSSDQAFIAINQNLINDFKEGLSAGVTLHAEKLTHDILLDTTKRSMKVKTKEVVRGFLESLVSGETYNLILKEVEKIGAGEIKVLYTDALENILQSSDLTDFNEEEIKEIKEIAVAIEKKELNGAELISENIQSHLIENIVDYLFNNVDLEWTNAINIRTAIGQGNNAFTPVQIGRYIAGIANGETVFDLKVVNGLMDNKGKAGYTQFPDKVFRELSLKDSSLQAVHKGMDRVVNGREGSARTAFVNSSTVVAGKTGTAQEGETEHSWFAGFAPFGNPEVAVVTTMYSADGLGRFNYLLASDVFDAIFEEEDARMHATMDNVFVE